MNYEETKVIAVHLEDIIPNPFQPRLAFNEDKIQELAESIKTHGVIEPLILRNNGDKYEIIAGERRYKASALAGLPTVPAIVMDVDNNKSAEIALVENLQRKNLTSIEEAKSYEKLQDRGYSQEEIGKKMGVSQSSIANKLRLLNLADEVQRALLEEKISERHARSLLSLDKTRQVELLSKVINDRLTVKQLDEEIARMQNGSVVSPTNDFQQKAVTNYDSMTNIEELFSNANSNQPVIQNNVVVSNEPVSDLEIFNIPPIEVAPEETTPTIESFTEITPMSYESYDNKITPVKALDEEVNPSSNTDELSFPEPVFNKTEAATEQAVIQQNSIIITKEDFSTVIRSFDQLKKDIENAGLQISMETFDFDEYYQLIIKVYKS